METKLLIFMAFIIGNVIGISAQKHAVAETREDLEKLVFQRNQTSINFIHIDKATYDQSIDSEGWVKRIKEKKFGFPNFEKDMIAEISGKVEARKKDTSLNSSELYHSVAAEIVDNFFTGEDQDHMIQQIRSAKSVRWDPLKFSYNFSDTSSAIKISEPYYSLDKTKAIVFVISPILERAEFYQKVDGKWKYYFGSLLWIE